VGNDNEVALRRARLVLRWVTVPGYSVLVYVTSHSGQLNLLPSEGWEMSTGQEAVAMLCSREDNRRFGVALAMLYTDCLVYIYGLSGLTKRDK